MRDLTAWCLAIAFSAGTASAAPEWRQVPGAPVAGRIDDLHFLDAQRGWACTSEGEIHRTPDGGGTWQMQLQNSALYFRSIRFADDQVGFAGTLSTSALLHRTTNGGATWSVVPNLPVLRPNGVCGLAVPTSQVIYGVGSWSGPARMIKSSDGGATWSSQELAPLASTAIDIHFTSATEGLVVGSVGTFPTSNVAVVLRTTDGGATWSRRFLGTRPGEWGWKITFPTPLIGYVSLERNSGPMFFLKTVDGGITWAEHPFVDFNEQGIGFVTPLVGWVGGAFNPTFGTIDGGETWTQTPWGGYINRFQFLAPDLGYASGVTIYKYSEGSLDAPGGPLPRPTRASPNPFAARTTIEFTLRAAGRVELFVADPAGRVVRRFERRVRGAGPHRLEWDGLDDAGRPAPPGVYLYVIHAGEQHEMGKLVRVR